MVKQLAKALMIQGTGSGAGKSMIVTAFCRIFSDMGISVAPFKAQNMALNSFITMEGGEIGRAQALQAEAARIEPTVDMNPILLKASGDMGSQVIIHGKVHANMKAREYYSFKSTAWESVKDSYSRLSGKYDLLVIEGAGSPAEINLVDVDIVNMAVAKHARAPVVLVGDIDKGGVFASLYGTVKLLGRDSRRVKAFIVNKFRGDLGILNPGLEMIRSKTGKPVIGVLPYIKEIGLPEEDGLTLYQGVRRKDPGLPGIKVVVVKLQYISNFTDFDPFLCEPEIELLYSSDPSEIEAADIVIIPGSKNTVKDLISIQERHLAESLLRANAKGIQIIGICGGYQMLGRKIYDPCGAESICKESNGIGLLDMETTFGKDKSTFQAEATVVGAGFPFPVETRLKGYEIHMGESVGDIGLFEVKRVHGNSGPFLEGSINGNCWGTYLHGIFDNDSFRRGVINQARERKGLPPAASQMRYADIKDKAIDNLADIIRDNTDMNFVKELINL